MQIYKYESFILLLFYFISFFRVIKTAQNRTEQNKTKKIINQHPIVINLNILLVVSHSI